MEKSDKSNGIELTIKRKITRTNSDNSTYENLDEFTVKGATPKDMPEVKEMFRDSGKLSDKSNIIQSTFALKQTVYALVIGGAIGLAGNTFSPNQNIQDQLSQIQAQVVAMQAENKPGKFDVSSQLSSVTPATAANNEKLKEILDIKNNDMVAVLEAEIYGVGKFSFKVDKSTQTAQYSNEEPQLQDNLPNSDFAAQFTVSNEKFKSEIENMTPIETAALQAETSSFLKAINDYNAKNFPSKLQLHEKDSCTIEDRVNFNDDQDEGIHDDLSSIDQNRIG